MYLGEEVNDFASHVVHRSDDIGTVQGLVASGVGIAVVPRLMAEPNRPDIAIIEIAERLQPCRVALAWRSDSQSSPARDAFIETTGKVCAGLGLVASLPTTAIVGGPDTSRGPIVTQGQVRQIA